jgi:DNA topoisomerase-3
MRLFIAEKPSVARAIVSELGQTEQRDPFSQCGNDSPDYSTSRGNHPEQEQ